MRVCCNAIFGVLFPFPSHAVDEDLIRYGYEEDIWFHVDKLSSAHVYVRLNAGMTMDTMTKELIDDCCQLVKANSIEGTPSIACHGCPLSYAYFLFLYRK